MIAMPRTTTNKYGETITVFRVAELPSLEEANRRLREAVERRLAKAAAGSKRTEDADGSLNIYSGAPLVERD